MSHKQTFARSGATKLIDHHQPRQTTSTGLIRASRPPFKLHPRVRSTLLQPLAPLAPPLSFLEISRVLASESLLPAHPTASANTDQRRLDSSRFAFGPPKGHLQLFIAQDSLQISRRSRASFQLHSSPFQSLSRISSLACISDPRRIPSSTLYAIHRSETSSTCSTNLLVNGFMTAISGRF